MRDRVVALIADRTHSGVVIGSTRAEVREALGEPEDVSAIRASIWKYGDLEVSFHEGRVFLLVLHARDSGPTLPELQRLLDERSIPYEIDPALTSDSQITIQTATGATVVFDADETLDSVSIT